ncbi:odorant receptor 85b-like [Venturia canescens]|uniref:odorant receptor 85b-like n=1 Tax=Venturia canescens TaxID=32260 RepID=UPI001C9C4667|nr:odorant receptor 85b-like [Venturia canescens]
MTSTVEAPAFEIYSGDLLNFMRYCKIWKADKFSAIKNALVRLTVGILLASDVAIIVTTLIDFKNASNDLTSFAAYVGPLCLQCIGLMKWSYCIWKVNEIAQLVGILKRCHYFALKINENDSGWKKYKREMRSTRLHYLTFLYGWLWLCVYGVLHWCSNPIILEMKESGFGGKGLMDEDNSTGTRARYLPYLGWRPWDVSDNTGYFCLFFVQFIGGLSSALGSITYDVFYIASLMMICAHLRYLNDSLTDVKTEGSLRSNVGNLKFELKLKNCVDHHNEILTFLDALEILASPAMFVQCFENIIVLCLVSLEASTVQVNTSLKTIMKLWSMLEYFLSVIAQLFVYCYYATEIRTLGLQIADSVYLSDWEQVTCSNTEWDDDRPTWRIHYFIQMFMLRSQKAIILTGGPFYVLSLETFKSIVGLAMSNSVILRQVVERG